MDCRHSIASTFFGCLLGLVAASAAAADIVVLGLFPNKAVVQIDGSRPQTLSVGRKSSTGVTLISADRNSATFDVAGERMTLKIGQQRASGRATSAATAVLKADVRGHFIAGGQINGLPIRFIVDTGATAVTIPVSEAQRIALDYRKGQRVQLNTANGRTTAYRVRLDTVRVGDVSVNSVDALVIDGASLPAALLGMSFLNRMTMTREGDTLTLTKRY